MYVNTYIQTLRSTYNPYKQQSCFRLISILISHHFPLSSSTFGCYHSSIRIPYQDMSTLQEHIISLVSPVDNLEGQFHSLWSCSPNIIYFLFHTSSIINYTVITDIPPPSLHLHHITAQYHLEGCTLRDIYDQIAVDPEIFTNWPLLGCTEFSNHVFWCLVSLTAIVLFVRLLVFVYVYHHPVRSHLRSHGLCDSTARMSLFVRVLDGFCSC